MLEKGDTYPSSADSKRIVLENYYENLLLNKSTGNSEFREANGTITKIPKDPLVPIPQTISDISADLLLGEFPAIILPEARQQAFDDWAFDTDLGTKMLEAATYVSAIGTVFSSMFKIDNEIVYSLQPANRVTWVEKFGKFENVKFILSISQAKDNNKIIYEIQEWSKPDGQLLIQHYAAVVRISDTKVLEVRELSNPERPGIDFVPIAKWLNVGIMGANIGRSDYDGKGQLFSEIDNRVDQNNNTIEENQDPWKAMPQGVLDQNGQFNRASYGAKMFEKTGGGQADNQVDIMAWDANMPAAFTQIDTMLDLTFFTARLSDPITGRMKGGLGSNSGESLKWQSVSTIAMKQRKEKYASAFIRDFINQWSKLDGDEVIKKDIKIEWQDGLPIDEKQKTEAVVQQVNAGLMSKQTAVEKLQELGTEDAQQEIDRIQNDETFTAQTEASTLAPIQV